MDTFYIVANRTRDYDGEMIYVGNQVRTYDNIKDALARSKELAERTPDKVFFVMAACFRSGVFSPVVTEAMNV